MGDEDVGEGVGADTALIRALGARGHLGEALELYHTSSAAVRPPVQPRASEQLQLLNAALLACARAEDAAAALDVFHASLQRHPGAVDAVSVNTLLAACERSGDAAALVAGFDALLLGARHGAADGRSVATLLSGCALHGDAQLAVRVYTWAMRSGLTRTLTRALHGVLFDGLVEAAEPTEDAITIAADAGGFAGGAAAFAHGSVRGILGCVDSLRAIETARAHAARGCHLRPGARAGAWCAAHSGGRLEGALARLHELERERGELAAPCERTQHLLVDHVVASSALPEHAPLEETSAALRLFTAFAEQRSDPRWGEVARGASRRAPRGRSTLQRLLTLDRIHLSHQRPRARAAASKRAGDDARYSSSSSSRRSPVSASLPTSAPSRTGDHHALESFGPDGAAHGVTQGHADCGRRRRSARRARAARVMRSTTSSTSRGPVAMDEIGIAHRVIIRF